MAKIHNYKVTLHPAHKDGGFVVTKVDIFGGTYPESTITAAGMPDLIRQVTTFANEHGKGCSASVRCLAPRKPPGFKAATQKLYFNLKEGEDAEDVNDNDAAAQSETEAETQAETQAGIVAT